MRLAATNGRAKSHSANLTIVRCGLLTLSAVFTLLLAAVQPARAETVVYSFGVFPDGEVPYAGLIMDKAGNFYGTTYAEGTHLFGTVFKVTPSGKETVLYSFGSHSGDGTFPYAGLVMDTKGNLYGTTTAGGANGVGTVFKLTPAGTETILHSFSQSGDGYSPIAGLVIDTEGNLYGTTPAGGANFSGTVFKVTRAGKERVLYSFCPQSGCPDGSHPMAGVIRDTNGNLYGTTSGGGAYVSGTVFELTPTGTETVRYSFNPAVDGYQPFAGVIRDGLGNLYGTTTTGGAHGFGTVFKVAPSRKETVLYSFGSNSSDGQNPQYAGVVRDTNGNLYGTTTYGGAHGFGTVFKVKPSGRETVLYSFGSQSGDGHFPWASGVVMDTKGNLYGTNEAGGAHSYGTVFKVTP
jgi:uncharacterized repeat protein (TIGR03803 family)